jgi:hypothetical protein
MVHALAKNWWLLLLRGIAAIIFGVLAFAWPGVTLLTLILFYGAFALVDGVLAIIAAITGGAPGPRWWLAIVGLLGRDPVAQGDRQRVAAGSGWHNIGAVWYRRDGGSGCRRAGADLGNRHLCHNHRRAARRAGVSVEETRSFVM